MAALRSIAPASLPPAPLARGTAEVAGKTVAIRSLTRGEQLHMQTLGGGYGEPLNREQEIYLITCGLDVSPEEAATWWEDSDPVAVTNLVMAIGTVSRIVGKAGPSPLAPKKSRSASSSKAS